MKDATKKELIGLDIKARFKTGKTEDAKNNQGKTIEGRIIDETKKTITIKTKKGDKKLIKEFVKIEFVKDKLMIDGKLLVGRPEERIKKN